MRERAEEKRRNEDEKLTEKEDTYDCRWAR